jgi:hypothetical protein
LPFGEMTGLPRFWSNGQIMLESIYTVSEMMEQSETDFTWWWPRSVRAIPAHRLATTEQSVAASCTRSMDLPELMSGPSPLLFSGNIDGGGSAFVARVQPSKNCCWYVDKANSRISLLR